MDLSVYSIKSGFMGDIELEIGGCRIRNWGMLNLLKKFFPLLSLMFLETLIFNTNNINKHHMPSIFILKAML